MKRIIGIAVLAVFCGTAQASTGILMRSEIVSYDGLWKCTYQVMTTPIAVLIHSTSGCPYSMEF